MNKPLVESEDEKPTSKLNRVTKRARSATKYGTKYNKKVNAREEDA